MGLQAVHYVTEDFTFHWDAMGTRKRPVLVLAWFQRGHSGLVKTTGATSLFTNEEPLALYQPNGTIETAANAGKALDYSLINCDDGHLIGSQLGGTRNRCNLVPMHVGLNRGGPWAAFETKVANAIADTGFDRVLLAVRCHYDDKEDARVPVEIEAAAAKVDNADMIFVLTMEIMATGLVVPRGTLAATLSKRILRSVFRRQVVTPVSHVFGPQTVVEQSKTTIFSTQLRQSPVLMQASPSKHAVDLSKLYTLLKSYPDHWDYTVEDDHSFGMTPVREGGGARNFSSILALPPADKRPYAILDYLALHKTEELRATFVSPVDNPINLLVNRSNDSFTDSMKALVRATNRILAILSTGTVDFQSAVGYRSDADDDDGGLPLGNVAVPEIDHICPVAGVPTPNWMGTMSVVRGASIFSNAMLVSRAYNNAKRAKPPATRVYIGIPSQTSFTSYWTWR